MRTRRELARFSTGRPSRRHAATRTPHPRRARAGAALVLAGALAIASAGAGQAAATVDAAAATEVVLQVRTAGGFAASSVPTPPTVTLYGDGHLITADSPAAPAPALVDLSDRTLTPAGVQRVLAAAQAARLAEAPYTDAVDPDGQATVFTLRRGSQVITSQFSVLSPQGGDSPDLADRRAKAATLLEQLRQVESLVGPEASPAQPFTPQRVAVSVRPVLGGGDAEIRPWPAPSVDLAALADAGSCAVLDGSNAAAVRGALAGQAASTQWQERGQLWRIFAAPLLPEQPGCPAAAAG